METFDLSNYFGPLPKEKEKQRIIAVTAALEIIKAEEKRITVIDKKNTVTFYADMIEEALKVKDE